MGWDCVSKWIPETVGFSREKTGQALGQRAHGRSGAKGREEVGKAGVGKSGPWGPGNAIWAYPKSSQQLIYRVPIYTVKGSPCWL